ncbi:MAG: MFS transporter [Clostridiales Family XIII bacterium]|jgi:probable glucitol transport protein GutA|nr:MFS transporter [Clostridiales Family XIII bacterium]
MKNNIKQAFQTTAGERMAYGVFGVGMNIFFVLTQYFLQQYYLINAAVPASMVAVVFLIVKIWDAVNDPLFGVIVDKSRFKRGKYLPWMRIATFFLPVAAAALFFVPDSFSAFGKAIFLLVVYMLFDAAATMTEVPAYAVTIAMTSNPGERSQMISSAKFIGTVFALVVLVIPTMYESIGWHTTVSIFALLAMLTMLPGCFKIKERHRPAVEQTLSVKDILRYLTKNKYLLLFFFSAILYGCTNTVGAISNLFAIYNLGGDDKIVPLLVIATLPGIFVILAVKLLLNRFDKFHLQIAALAVTAVTSAVMYFAGYGNTALFYTLIGIRSLSMGAHTMLYFLFAPDCAEYGIFKTGMHAEGATFAIQSFASKTIGALSGAIALFLLAAIGFQEGMLTQPQPVQHGLWILFSAFPLIGSGLQAAILLLFYRLRDKDVIVMSRANNGEISREEALELLSKNRKGKPIL